MKDGPGLPPGFHIKARAQSGPPMSPLNFERFDTEMEGIREVATTFKNITHVDETWHARQRMAAGSLRWRHAAARTFPFPLSAVCLPRFQTDLLLSNDFLLSTRSIKYCSSFYFINDATSIVSRCCLALGWDFQYF